MKRARLHACLSHTAALLPAVGLVLSLFLSEPLSVLLLSLGAILFHELGHLCFFALCGLPLPRLTARGAGIRLLPATPLLPLQEGLICFGGPLFNFLAAFFLFRVVGGGFGTTGGGLHLLYGLFNLLPFANTDGERLLRLFLLFLFPKEGKRVCRFLSLALLVFLFFFCLFLYYLTGYGLCGLFFALFCYFSPEKETKTFFEISREKRRI